MTAIIINAIAVVLLVWSFIKEKPKTIKALKMALIKGISLLPIVLFVTALIGFLFAMFPPGLIKEYLGGSMNLTQIAAAAVAGAITMIPSLIAMPLAGSLIDAGASYTSVTAFITTLTMVGFVTLPMEIKELGKKITLWRNILAFLFAIVISVIMGVIM